MPMFRISTLASMIFVLWTGVPQADARDPNPTEQLKQTRQRFTVSLDRVSAPVKIWRGDIEALAKTLESADPSTPSEADARQLLDTLTARAQELTEEVDGVRKAFMMLTELLNRRRVISRRDLQAAARFRQFMGGWHAGHKRLTTLRQRLSEPQPTER